MKKWYEEEADHSDVVVSAAICLFRNLDHVPFPSRMDMPTRKAVREKIQTVFLSLKDSDYKEFDKFFLESVPELQTISFAELGLISAEMAEDRDGRALFLSQDEGLSVAVNGEDHLMIQAKAAGLQLQEAYSAADRLDTFLNRSLTFAFDAQLGYLSQNPFRLGTGMIASLRLHLPALFEAGSTGRIAQNFSKLGLTLRGVYGPEASPKGALFRLSNQVTMGLSEQEALSNLSSMANQLISRERHMREELLHQVSIQDGVLRNLGVLQNARLLPFEEFLKRVSAVRFGIVSGIIHGISVQEIDALILKTYPATLIFHSGKVLTEEECQKLRAFMVREVLKQGMEGL